MGLCAFTADRATETGHSRGIKLEAQSSKQPADVHSQGKRLCFTNITNIFKIGFH